MLVLTETPTPLPTDTPTPTPTPTETGTPTPTPTYLDKINVIARENSFFNSPAEGYTDEKFVDEIPTSLLEDAINEFNQESIEEENQIIDEIQIDDTSSEEDEKKNLTEFQPQTLDLVISEDLETEVVMETSESIDYSTESQVEDLYWEKDDNNPNQIIYDLENNQVIIPSSEEEIITPTPTPKNVISRNVSPRRRNFR
jgi:Zn-dependent metalloprotease